MKKTIILITFLLIFVSGILAQEFAAAPPWNRPFVMAGTITGAWVTYKDAYSVTVKTGYGECNGEYWEILTNTTVTLTSVLPSGEDYVYIYIDDSASSYPTPTLIGSTTEPLWSDSKLGWYNGDDRCIGMVWSPSSGATILPFILNRNLEFLSDDVSLKEALVNGNPNGTYQALETTAYTPVMATAVNVTAHNTDLDDSVYVRISTYDNQYHSLRANSYASITYVEGWLSFNMVDSRDLYYVGEDNDDNALKIVIKGFRYTR